MTITGHIRLILSMTLLLLPFLALAQGPFGYIPLNTAPVVPEAVDIVVEPLTYTPDFFAGRAEPISASQVKLVAIPHSSIAANALKYRWSLSGTNVNEAPAAENQSVTVTLPVGPTLQVKVEVFNNAGQPLAVKSETIPLSNMELAFYENNALRGLNKVAITDNLIMVGEEITVKAIPYFSNPSDINTNLKTFWTVGGIEEIPSKPWELTLQRSDLSRDSLINFVMQNHRSLESAEKTFTLKL